MKTTSSRYTLWHNPRCSKSRKALALLHERNIAPDIRDYVQRPPKAADLQDLLRRLALPARDLLRTNEDVHGELGLGNPAIGDDTLIAAMAVHPQLIQRPILIAGERAIIARPPERVLELLPQPTDET